MPEITPTSLAEFRRQPARFADLPRLGRVCRLGLATRGNTSLDREAVLEAVERGVNYLNWCGYPDGMQEAIREIGPRREDVKVAIQFDARTADAARREFDNTLAELNTDYIDVATYYYVEHPDEWRQIIGPGGAAEVLEEARENGTLRAIGLTSHQRPLAAEAAASGRLDVLMIRYNAAHRRAETLIFPVTDEHRVPVVAFTCMRWGALMKCTPDDPPGYAVPPAEDWYRFVLCQPSVSVALMAPNGTEELRQNLRLLDDWRGFNDAEYDALAAHGKRVHQHAGGFP